MHWFTVNSFHRQIRIIATSVVETDRPLSDPRTIADTWPLSSRDYEYSVYDFLQFGGPIVDSPQLRALADELRPAAGSPLGELAMRMLAVISEWFTYQKGVTTAASPITDILEKRSGVCQDFTHLMIGLAARWGFLRGMSAAWFIPTPRNIAGLHRRTRGARCSFRRSDGWDSIRPIIA